MIGEVRYHKQYGKLNILYQNFIEPYDYVCQSVEKNENVYILPGAELLTKAEYVERVKVMEIYTPSATACISIENYPATSRIIHKKEYKNINNNIEQYETNNDSLIPIIASVYY